MSHQDPRWANKAVRGLVCAGLALLSPMGCGARGEGLTDSDVGASTSTGTSTTTVSTSTLAPTPVALYVNTHDGCAESRPMSSAIAELTPQGSGEGVDVVEVFFQDECTGAGGQHIIARGVESGWSEAWLGGHACYFFSPPGSPPPLGPAFGVLRYNMTAALFQLPPELCLGFPGEPFGLQTSLITEAVGVFATLEGAQAFAASVQAGMP